MLPAARGGWRVALGTHAGRRFLGRLPSLGPSCQGQNVSVSDDLEQRLASAQARVRELPRLGKSTRDAWRAAYADLLQAERDLAASRGEQYAVPIDIGPRWDTGAPLPHVVGNGTRTFVACLADQPDPGWDGSYVTVASVDDEHPSLFVVIELWGCRELRMGGPNDEAVAGHPLDGKGLAAYRAHEVVNSAWIEDAIHVNSVHPNHSDEPIRQLHHYALLFHDEMIEALARGIEARLIQGTLRAIMADLTGSLLDQPYRSG